MFPAEPRSIYLILGSTDMRKGFDTLSILAASRGCANPCDGSLYVFCNRQRTIIKIVYWDRNGFCIFQKKMNKDKFFWQITKNDVKKLHMCELRWLLDGLNIDSISTSADNSYKNVI